MNVKVGRPLKFETPEDLQGAIESYLNNTPREEWTVTGLALAIGTSRTVLDDYQGREGYREIVTNAKLFIENSYELSLRKTGRTGDIFALKNFGWEDRQYVDGDNKTKVELIVDRGMMNEAFGEAASRLAGRTDTDGTAKDT